MKRAFIVAGILAISAAACSNDNGTISTSPIPSSVITSASAAASQAVCDAQSKLSQFLGQVQSGATPSKADADALLSQVQTTLDQEATTQDGQGNSGLAGNLRTLSASVGVLKSAVDTLPPAAIAAPAQAVAGVIASLNLCPSA
jgi:hypothetical protein